MQIWTDIKSSFSYRPAGHSDQLEDNPVLSRSLSDCFYSLSVIWWPHFRLHCKIEWLCQTVYSFISLKTKATLTLETDSCQRRRKGANRVFWKNFILQCRTIRRASTEISVARGRYVNWFDVQVTSAESVPLISCLIGEGKLRLNGLLNIQNNKYRSEDNPKILNTVQLRDLNLEYGALWLL